MLHQSSEMFPDGILFLTAIDSAIFFNFGADKNAYIPAVRGMQPFGTVSCIRASSRCCTFALE